MNKISVLKALNPLTGHLFDSEGNPYSCMLITKTKDFEEPVELCTFEADPPYRYIGTKLQATVIKARLEKMYPDRDYLIVEISV